MFSTLKATMHRMIGAMTDDLFPPRDLAKAASAVMIWASSKMGAEERKRLVDGLNMAIRDPISSLPGDPISSLPGGTMATKNLTPNKPKRKQPRKRPKRAQPRDQGV